MLYSTCARSPNASLTKITCMSTDHYSSPCQISPYHRRIKPQASKRASAHFGSFSEPAFVVCSFLIGLPLFMGRRLALFSPQKTAVGSRSSFRCLLCSPTSALVLLQQARLLVFFLSTGLHRPRLLQRIPAFPPEPHGDIAPAFSAIAFAFNNSPGTQQLPPRRGFPHSPPYNLCYTCLPPIPISDDNNNNNNLPRLLA